ncbi:hypothetical protein [Streptomyces sp. NPDC049040]|uniref:hypothetical protein n=1 Tax=Streptomyces sp. NPDC049040 TaxID=3365593 RepID=UPI003724B054
MPTPHGNRGGMAFSADELQVLRRALAEVLHPSRTFAGTAVTAAAVPRPAEHVRDCLRLAEAVDDAVQEAGRLRAFLLAELRRYREALPGSAAGYLERLTDAVAAGYLPGAEDLAALRRLRAQATGSPEHHRRTALLRHCENLADNDVRLCLEAHMPAPRRLLALPGPSAAEERPASKPDAEPAPKPAAPPAPGAPKPAEPDPGRRTPTPAEIWPPGRRPAPRRDDEDERAVPAALAGLVGPRRAC